MEYDSRREENTTSPKQQRCFLLHNLQALVVMSRNACAGQI